MGIAKPILKTTNACHLEPDGGRVKRWLHARRVVGECPDVEVSVGNTTLRCLLDTGAQVSTITESFYKEHLAHLETRDVSAYLTISGAQGLEIPYIGFIELTLRTLGHTFPNMGFLIVRDPIATAVA